MLFLSGTEILRGDIHDAVRVNIKGNLDLRNASPCRRDSIQTELSKRLVIAGKLSLTLYNMNVDSSLIIRRGGEDLALLGRDRRVALDQLCGNAAQRLDRQRQRRDIQKKDVAGTCISCELSALDRGTDCNALIRVQRLARFLTGQRLNLILNRRNTG